MNIFAIIATGLFCLVLGVFIGIRIGFAIFDYEGDDQ